jgi:hypothetical protein
MMMGTRDRAVAALLAIGLAAAPAAAQTDYYNTDEGRPVRIEDAAPVERHAFELQLAPVRLERAGAGVYHWEIEPEIAYGILPRTHVEVGFPLAFQDAAGTGGGNGLAGIHLSAMHNLNVETRTFPAFAVAGDLALPVGPLAPEGARASLKGIATRTFGFGRLHANGVLSLGGEPTAGDAVAETSAWMAGVAYDRAIPLRSLLATVDLFAERPWGDESELEWTTEAGLRYQTSPQFNLDIGVGRRFAGEEEAWMFTFGLSHAFAIRSLMGGR